MGEVIDLYGEDDKTLTVRYYGRGRLQFTAGDETVTLDKDSMCEFVKWVIDHAVFDYTT